MFTFLRKLLGKDYEELAEEERFKKNLEALRESNRQLTSVKAELDKIVSRVDKKSQELKVMTKTSGQHALNLNLETLNVGRESKPSF